MTDSLDIALAQRAIDSAPPREPGADERATLRLWGWRETGDAGWWRDPEGHRRYAWQRALRVIARDAARGDLPPSSAL